MKDTLYNQFSNPTAPHFWDAWNITITLLIALIPAIIALIVNNSISKTTKALISGVVETYLQWVKVKSKSEKVSTESYHEWIREYGITVLMGRSYLVYKKVTNAINKRGHDIVKLDELAFTGIVREYDSAPKWSRIEW